MIEILKKFSVLYVEDDLITFDSVKSVLENHVKELYTANNGREGIELYKKYQPDIIITDICMDQLDGIEMAKQIKQIKKDQSIILMTAHDHDNDLLKKTIDLGVCKVLFKPIEDIKMLIDPLITIATTIQNQIDSNELKLLKIKEEREEFLLGVIKQISHHWRQPLSIISSLSSSLSYKKEMGIETSLQEDIDAANVITRKTQELAKILEAIDNINYKDIKIEEIEELIKVSNPIYQEKDS